MYSGSSSVAVYERASSLSEKRVSVSLSKDASAIDTVLWKPPAEQHETECSQPSSSQKRGRKDGRLERDDARIAMLHCNLGLLANSVAECTREFCAPAAAALIDLAKSEALRSSLLSSADDLVSAAVIHTGGPTVDSALLFAPLVSALQAR
jgi:hypothetical protein